MSEPDWLRRDGDDLVLELRIQPRAPRDEVVGTHGGRLKLRLTAPPAEGKANAHLQGFLATEFGVPRSQVHILAGHRGRDKRVRVSAPRRRPGWLAEP